MSSASALPRSLLVLLLIVVVRSVPNHCTVGCILLTVVQFETEIEQIPQLVSRKRNATQEACRRQTRSYPVVECLKTVNMTNVNKLKQILSTYRLLSTAHLPHSAQCRRIGYNKQQSSTLVSLVKLSTLTAES